MSALGDCMDNEAIFLMMVARDLSRAFSSASSLAFNNVANSARQLLSISVILGRNRDQCPPTRKTA